MTTIVIPSGPLTDEQLRSWVQDTFARLLPAPGALRGVRVERYPGERMVVITVGRRHVTDALAIAQLLRLDLVKVDPAAGLVVESAG